MEPIQLILVGGFLGAGKTTLLGQTATALARSGKKVGVITNDQADDLVDTGLLKGGGFGVQEVAGGCFCCRFDDLIDAANRLIDSLKPDVLLGEPVGSCTDISATVLQPLKDLYGDRFRIAAFSVLADPARLRDALSDTNPTQFPDSVLYIFRKQLEEADVIVLNKTDLLSAEELDELKAMVEQRFPKVRLLTMSALNGEGVAEWLQVVESATSAGKRVVEVDYDTYAEGEAVLGWLNATVSLTAPEAIGWREFTESLMAVLWREFGSLGAEIAHLKCLLQTSSGSLVANATGSSQPPALRGELSGPTDQAALILNARVHMTPEALQETITSALAEASGEQIEAQIGHMQSLSPGRPEPKHRYDRAL